MTIYSSSNDWAILRFDIMVASLLHRRDWDYIALMESPLHRWHVQAGAKLADFGGWDMPIEYPKVNYLETGEIPGGTLAEHAAVRNNVGLFDVSHLGKISITGAGARDFLNSVVTNDLDRVAPGGAQYSLLCDDRGGTIDDLIVYVKELDDLFLIPNAANCQEVFNTVSALAPSGITVANVHTQFAVFALQGPRSGELLDFLGISHDLEYMAFSTVKLPDIGETIICRTGYTGEFGFELLPSWSGAMPLWNRLLDGIRRFDGRVAGLAARDTLRTEMGYPLHGHELSLSISPLQGGATWAVALSKEKFAGREALIREKSEGVKRISRAILISDRGIPRTGMSVENSAGRRIGEVTSGTFSPTLRCGIALALLEPGVVVGDEVKIDIRGRKSSGRIVKLPFVPSHVR
jgi:aminomethyltransferase